MKADGKSWILPAALIVDALTEILILSYYNTSVIAKILTIIVAVLCSVTSIILIIINLIKKKDGISELENTKLKKALVSIALIGLLITPTVWSGTTMFYTMSGTFPICWIITNV